MQSSKDLTQFIEIKKSHEKNDYFSHEIRFLQNKENHSRWVQKKGYQSSEVIWREIAGQNFLALLHEGQPKYDSVIDKTTQELSVISEEVDDFISFYKKEAYFTRKNILNGTYSGFYFMTVLALFWCEADLKLGNLGTTKNRVIKIDGDWLVAALRKINNSETLKYGNKNFEITQEVVQCLPCLPFKKGSASYYAYNWGDNIWTGIHTRDYALLIRSSKPTPIKPHTYVLVKEKNDWEVYHQDTDPAKKETRSILVKDIPGLKECLSDKSPDQLIEKDHIEIRKCIDKYQSSKHIFTQPKNRDEINFAIMYITTLPNNFIKLFLESQLSEEKEINRLYEFLTSRKEQLRLAVLEENSFQEYLKNPMIEEQLIKHIHHLEQFKTPEEKYLVKSLPVDCDLKKLIFAHLIALRKPFITYIKESLISYIKKNNLEKQTLFLCSGKRRAIRVTKAIIEFERTGNLKKLITLINDIISGKDYSRWHTMRDEQGLDWFLKTVPIKKPEQRKMLPFLQETSSQKKASPENNNNVVQKMRTLSF